MTSYDGSNHTFEMLSKKCVSCGDSFRTRIVENRQICLKCEKEIIDFMKKKVERA
jgi:hypothetical protein